METRFVLLMLLGASSYAQTGTFTPTGNMIVPRFGHTATLLPTGKVLITGGATICYPCTIARGEELYDPVTGTFAAFPSTGSMISSHGGGVLLPDGMVLFAESHFKGTLASVELYDPSTGNFSTAGAAATLTAVYSLTLLNDGRVLFTGRAGTSVPSVAGAEIYDPVVGTFSPVANWPQDVIGSPRTVLADGTVQFRLVVYPPDIDGTDGFRSVLYDPATGSFSDSVTTMFSYRYDNPPLETLLLDGKWLLTGGYTFFGSVSSAEMYDPALGTIAVTGSMSTVRTSHSATLLPDGTVLVAGGQALYSVFTSTVPATASAEIYDSDTVRFSSTASMKTSRSSHTAVLLNNGQVLITGGALFNSPPPFPGLASAELYTPKVLIPAPVLFSVAGDGNGKGAIWHAQSGQIASADNPAVAGEALSMYTTSLVEGSAIPPQIAVGGRLAKVLYFGAVPDYPGYYQVNFVVPDGVAHGAAISVRLTYLTRSSNVVTIAVK